MIIIIAKDPQDAMRIVTVLGIPDADYKCPQSPNCFSGMHPGKIIISKHAHKINDYDQYILAAKECVCSSEGILLMEV